MIDHRHILWIEGDYPLKHRTFTLSLLAPARRDYYTCYVCRSIWYYICIIHTYIFFMFSKTRFCQLNNSCVFAKISFLPNFLICDKVCLGRKEKITYFEWPIWRRAWSWSRWRVRLRSRRTCPPWPPWPDPPPRGTGTPQNSALSSWTIILVKHIIFCGKKNP